jgi:hypothetical protein
MLDNGLKEAQQEYERYRVLYDNIPADADPLLVDSYTYFLKGSETFLNYKLKMAREGK